MISENATFELKSAENKKSPNVPFLKMLPMLYVKFAENKKAQMYHSPEPFELSGDSSRKASLN